MTPVSAVNMFSYQSLRCYLERLGLVKLTLLAPTLEKLSLRQLRFSRLSITHQRLMLSTFQKKLKMSHKISKVKLSSEMFGLDIHKDQSNGFLKALT